METHSAYNVKQLQVRKECFCPFTAGWKEPTGAEIACVMSQASKTKTSLADTFGLSPGQIENWFTNKETIPYPVWCLLGLSAGYGDFWLHRQ
ncbi:homeobox domain-containing protein (plasmid) [Serratia sp. JSRIV001]|uniref:homeobox domain-containing protein n=1 Tax=Serratia TaxID=613 RepID=UPI001CBBC801|nr:MULTISPECIES: homeobox domain-containing protein [unclassified Serratia (in: enterobacteria)]UAN48787.1 homeobox domain-containing protein [Serratia sp. JSRIV001]UAN54462.1 homeobox domain-containing protein [Serratia sp. JSRIV002]UAN60575.1 homeobox domain-containing protein [Serratia sp. JSRIV004]